MLKQPQLTIFSVYCRPGAVLGTWDERWTTQRPCSRGSHILLFQPSDHQQIFEHLCNRHCSVTGTWGNTGVAWGDLWETLKSCDDFVPLFSDESGNKLWPLSQEYYTKFCVFSPWKINHVFYNNGKGHVTCNVCKILATHCPLCL